MTGKSIRKSLVGVATMLTLLFGVATYAVAQFVGSDRVMAYETDTWRVWIPAGSSRIDVRGDGDTDLDCYVYDQDGDLLGLDNDYTDHCIVDVWQRRGGNIHVEITNLGNVYNRYTISVAP